MTIHPAILAIRNVAQVVIGEHDCRANSMMLEDLRDDESSINAHPASRFAWIITPAATRLVWVDFPPVDGVMYIKTIVAAYRGDPVQFYLWDGDVLHIYPTAPMLIHAYKRARVNARNVHAHVNKPADY